MEAVLEASRKLVPAAPVKWNEDVAYSFVPPVLFPYRRVSFVTRFILLFSWFKRVLLIQQWMTNWRH